MMGYSFMRLRQKTHSCLTELVKNEFRQEHCLAWHLMSTMAIAKMSKYQKTRTFTT